MTDEDTSLDEFAPFCCQVARRAARGAMPRRRGGSARVITCACAAVALVALLAVALLLLIIPGFYNPQCGVCESSRRLVCD